MNSGLNEIDWLYGVTTVGESSTWGLPEAGISLWAGESGVGKSRLAVELARVVARKGYVVLYLQNEVIKETFATWVKQDGGLMPNNLFVSDATKLSEQLRDIRASKAQLVIVDSINMVSEFNAGSDKNIKRVIEGYRQACKETGCHIIFISQLTKDGEARGSATLSHLVDIVFHLNKQGSSDLFSFTVGNKHRYGRTGDNFFSFWGHSAKGVVCCSDYSTEDELWCKTHGIPINPRIAQYIAAGAAFQAAQVEEERKEEAKFRRRNIYTGIARGVIQGVGSLLTMAGAAFAGLMTYEAFRDENKS